MAGGGRHRARSPAPDSIATSRRSVLAAIAQAAVLLPPLSACSVRLEDDAPRIPLVPTREPIADEAALLAALGLAADRYAAASGAASRSAGPRGRVLSSAAARALAQVSTLRSVLQRRGVPAVTVDAAGPEPSPGGTAPSSTASPSPAARPTADTSTAPTAASATTGTAGAASAPTATTGTEKGGAATAGRTTAGRATPAPTTARPTTAEAAVLASGPGPAEVSALLLVSPANRTLLASLLVERAITAALLRAAGAGPAAGSATSWAAATPPRGSLAVRPLQAMQAARYGLQVAVAQSDTAGRRPLQAALDRVTGWLRELEDAAGPSAGPPAVGYALPFPVTTPAAARRLAAHLLPRLLPALVSGVPAAPDPPTLAWLLRTAADAAGLGAALGVTPDRFPGLAG